MGGAQKSLVSFGIRGVLASMTAGTVLCGCGGGGEKDSQPRTALSAKDFASENGGANAEAPPSSGPVAGSGPGYTVTRTGPFSAREGVFDVVSAPGQPVLATSASPSEEPVLIDAKVGDINGRPVFITDFFQSMDARLKTEAKNATDADAFLKVARVEIFRKLDDIINDELLQAEARASLTPEEKQGFRYWVQSLQSDYLSRNYSSRTMAEQRLAEGQEASSLEQWTRKREERELILLQLRSQVLKNVHVPFREVEQYYDRKYDEFNPPPTHNFRVISVSKREQETIDSIKKDLEGGADFAEVAGRPSNLFRAKEGGMYVPPPAPKPDPKAAAGSPAPEPKYFEVPSLNDAAKGLTAGEWTGPIDTGSTVAFLKHEETQKPSTSLYDAQASIEQTLRNEKAKEMMDKYIGDLMKRASVDDVINMRLRLLKAALERYWAPLHGG